MKKIEIVGNTLAAVFFAMALLSSISQGEWRLVIWQAIAATWFVMVVFSESMTTRQVIKSKKLTEAAFVWAMKELAKTDNELRDLKVELKAKTEALDELAKRSRKPVRKK